MKNLKLFHKQLLLVSVLLLLELLLLATLQILLIQSEQQVAKAEEAEALRREGDLMAQELYEASTSLVTYGLTRSEAAGRRYSSLAMDIPLKLEKTERMAAVFPEEKEVLDHWRSVTSAYNTATSPVSS